VAKKKSKSKKKSAKRKSSGSTTAGRKRTGRKTSSAKKKKAMRKKRAPRRTASAKAGGVVSGGGHQLKVGSQLLYLAESDVSGLPWEPDEIVNHVQIALREHGRGKVEDAGALSLYPQRESLLTAMPAHVPNVQACGLKWLAHFPNNDRLGLPQVASVALLADPHSGFPLALMDATWLTARRGPAVSSVAARRLARPESRTAAIIGCGVQGRGHIPALTAVLPALEQIKLYDTDAKAAAAAARGWRGKLAHPVKIKTVDSAADAVRDADVIVTATRLTDKPDPDVPESWVRSGALAIAFDLDAVLDPELFERADRVYVDSVADVEGLMARGLLRGGLPDHLSGELGRLVAEKIPGRSADAERVACLFAGLGAVDVVLARAIYDKACRLGAGTLLDL
jgi:ornithine cyclodeaminase/alanine dehydrogenase